MSQVDGETSKEVPVGVDTTNISKPNPFKPETESPPNVDATPIISTQPEPALTPSISATLQQSIPTKPRSNSQLHSTRPAPPSPAPSRPGSQIVSPVLLTSSTFHTPSPSTSSSSRDRAGSTSSSRGGRRISNSSHPSRASSKPRPKSALGSSSFLAGPSGPSEGDSSTPLTTDASLATIPIPENSPTPDTVPSPPSKPPTPKQTVIIRDFAFDPTDSRFAGPGLPLSAPDEPPSHRSSRWGDSPDLGSASSSRKNSWSGFGLFSWGRLVRSSKRDSTDSTQSRDDGDEEDEDDFPVVVPDHDEDDYAFSESETGSQNDDEPWGFYRAAYAFEAVGEHEIGLEEGDVVEVRGRGGGGGWVVAVKRTLDERGRVVRLDEGGGGEDKEGLVPESYLEKAGELEMVPPSDHGNPTPPQVVSSPSSVAEI